MSLVAETDNDLNPIVPIFSFVPMEPRILKSIEIRKVLVQNELKE